MATGPQLHNYHMLVWAAMYDGQYRVALEAAQAMEGITSAAYLEVCPLTLAITSTLAALSPHGSCLEVHLGLLHELCVF